MTARWSVGGDNFDGATTPPPGLSNVVAISAGWQRTLALKGDGTVVAWGTAGDYVTDYFTHFTNVVAVSDSPSHLVAMINDGSPYIARQPSSLVIFSNHPAVFTVAALGVPPLAYQWRFNGVNIADATNSSLVLTNTLPTGEGDYDVVVSNPLGTVFSLPGRLSVKPEDLAGALDDPALTWSGGGGDASWFAQTLVTHDGALAARSGPISANQQSILQTTVTGPGTLSFWWKVSSASSHPLAFSVNGIQMLAIAGEADWRQQTVYLGEGTQTLQWTYSRNAAPVAGQDAGWLDQVAFTAGFTPPAIVTPPIPRTVAAGADVTFTVAAAGTPPLDFQWRFNGGNIPGATSSSLTLTNVQDANAGAYSVQVSRNYGYYRSDSPDAILTVNPAPPTVIVQPSSRVAAIRDSVSFHVDARGSLPFSYQWQFNNADISGATDSSLALDNVQRSNAGNYRVVVNNALGATASSNAWLAIAPRSVVAWGADEFGATDVPTGLTNVIALQGGHDFGVALESDGNVSAWGGFPPSSMGDIPTSLTNAVAIAAWNMHCLGLKSDGTVVGWGLNLNGQATPPSDLSNVVAVAGGYSHSLALKADGTVVGWGNNSSGQTNVPAGLSDIIAIAAGANHNLALKADGTVIGWGDNLYGQATPPAGLSNVVALAGGYYHSMALKSDGTVVAWGFIIQGDAAAPAGLSNVVAIAAGFNHCLALKSDGTIVGWGYNYFGQASIPNYATNAVGIAGGASHSLALLGDGSPFIGRQPLRQIARTGGDCTFSAGVLGNPPLTLQWKFNGVDIEGATDTFLTLTNVQLANAGAYTLVVSNPLGTVTSAEATLTVLRPTPRLAASTFGPAGLKLELSGLSSHGPVVIFASTNLVDWQPLFTNAPITGSLQFLDPAAANFPARFYRAVEQ